MMEFDTIINNVRTFLLMENESVGKEVLQKVFLYFFCLGTVLKVPPTKNCSWLHHLVLTLITGFAGGFFTPLFMKGLPGLFTNEFIIVFTMFNWYIVHYTPLQKYLKHQYVTAFITTMYEIFRANGLFKVVKDATEAYKGEKDLKLLGIFLGESEAVAIMGPIIIGTLSACLGFFLPFSKGLDAIKDGMPQPMQVPFIAAIFYHLTTHENMLFGGFLRGLFPSGEDNIKVMLILFFVFMALWTVFKGADSNPLTPVHTLLYRITRVSPLPSSLSYNAINEKPGKKETNSKSAKTPSSSKKSKETKKQK